MASKMIEKFIGQTCQSCHFGVYKEFSDGNEWNVICNDCGAIQFCYEPLPHQVEFHSDPSKYRLFAGGYGSGKTTTTVAEVIRHVLTTPNGMTLMGAATLPQLENTSMKQFFDMIPPGFISVHHKQKNIVDLINGHRVLFRPLDDEGKARSLNLSCFHIEEASEVNFDYFIQLQTRLRNHATDHHIGILSTNPDIGWVRSEFLLRSANIYHADRPYFVPEEDKNEDYATHIAPTRLNTYLPADFYASTARGKERWWVERYLNGSFSFAEGAVYKDFGEHIVKPFDIPKHWERLGGADFGINDPTVLLMGAIDPDSGIVYIYDEYYNNVLTVPKHAENMKKLLDPLPYGVLRGMVGDPSGKRRNINDHRSIFDHYSEYGIYFKEGDNRIDSGISKVAAYFALGRLKIFAKCAHTIKEGINYKYKPMEMDAKKNPDNKPIDKDNHTMDSLRYLVQELPDDPNNLKSKYYTPGGGKKAKKESIPFALQTEPRNSYNSSASSWYQNF
jgi:phage terminase large subunit